MTLHTLSTAPGSAPDACEEPFAFMMSAALISHPALSRPRSPDPHQAPGPAGVPLETPGPGRSGEAVARPPVPFLRRRATVAHSELRQPLPRLRPALLDPGVRVSQPGCQRRATR